LRGVNVDEQLAANLPPVMGHPGQLQEVVTNLVHNAAEAMSTIDDSPRMLRVRTEHTDGTVTLLVEDSGPGFDPSGIHQVFDAFVTSKPGGMGLGLAICRMIVDRHGGRISASPADPRGAVLRVDLLAADRDVVERWNAELAQQEAERAKTEAVVERRAGLKRRNGQTNPTGKGQRFQRNGAMTAGVARPAER
jgi:K+-sensing histidine kinase KdpD